MARRKGFMPVPLPVVADRLKMERSTCEDEYHYLVDPQIEVQNPHARVQERFQLRFGTGGGPAIGFSETSIGQYCRIVGLPTYVLERLPASVGLNVLRCMSAIAHERKPLKYLFRMKRNPSRMQLRALLHGSYVRFDDTMVMEHIQQQLEGHAMHVARMNITDDLFSLRLLGPREYNLGTEKARDPSFAGFDVRSSETGRYALQVRILLHRVVCSNGMTAIVGNDPHKIRRNNSRGKEDFARLLDEAVRSYIHEGPAMAARLTQMRSAYLPRPDEEIDRIFARHHLGSPRGRIARRIRDQVAPLTGLLGATQFDVVQAFTSVAQQLDHDWRPRVEDAMGEYVMERRRGKHGQGGDSGGQTRRDRSGSRPGESEHDQAEASAGEVSSEWESLSGSSDSFPVLVNALEEEHLTGAR